MAKKAQLDESEIISLYKKGLKICDIAKEKHSSFYPIRRILEKNGVNLHKGGNKKGYTPWNKGKPYLKLRGEKNPMWKDGRTIKSSQHRCHTIEYKNWKRALLDRDKACRMCGETGSLEANHIIPWRKCKGTEKEYALDNGIILCNTCHNKTKYKEHLFEDLLKSKL